MKPVYQIMFFVSVGLMVASVVFLSLWGLQLGVDFRGGSVMELAFTSRPPMADVNATLAKAPIAVLKDAVVSSTGTDHVVIKTVDLTEAQHQQVLGQFRFAFPNAGMTEVQFSSIGPAIGSELRANSVRAIIITLALIGLYIAFVFRAMRRTLSWWVMSFATVVAMAHDVLLPLGVFAILTHVAGVEISAVFVAAILTIIGYSISDTVVVFDRVRENILKGRLTRETSFAQVVHESIMQTLVRSINTNITVLITLVSIYFFGGASIRYFALALIIGIFSGAYSSIFVASPILVWLSRRKA